MSSNDQKAEWFSMHFSGLPHHKHGAKNIYVGVGKNTYFFDQLLISQFSYHFDTSFKMLFYVIATPLLC